MEAKPTTVLLVEDTPEDARLLQGALAEEKQLPYLLRVADSLSSGLQHLSEGGVDLVLLDLMLPDSRGLETLVKIRQQDPRVAIVVLTASDDDALALEALQRGAQDYLVKGYVQAYPRLLARSMRYAIERKRGDRVKDEFVSTMTHELRTPLATIQEFTGLLADQIVGPLTADQAQYLAIIKGNVKRLVRMVDGLLDMARIEAGHALLNRTVITLKPMLDQLLQSIRPMSENKGLKVVVEIPEPSPEVFADADKVVQVLLNLLGNAIKFTAGPGRITVGVVEQASEVEFSVADTGVGIAAEDIPRLFEKFQRGRSVSEKAGFKGTGLGLAISKRLVELHGGRIWVESTPAQGSTFFFTLPKYHPEELIREYGKSGIERAKRQGGSFSFIVLSLPTFQELKTRQGTEGVSRLLKELETMVQGLVRRRNGDVVMRWQKGEMVVILAELDRHNARMMAERLQRALGECTFTVEARAFTVPVAAVTATYPDDGKTVEALLAVTEARLRSFSSSKTRILVVDDEPKTRQFLKESLELKDFAVWTAAGGAEAIEQLKSQPVDVILLDLVMPVMGGDEVYRRLKGDALTRDIPIIIVTGNGEYKGQPLGPEGARHYIVKPFEMEGLVAKVRDVLPRSFSGRKDEPVDGSGQMRVA